MLSSKDELIVQPRRARYEVQAARMGDYAALTRAMSELLQLFSRDVAQTLEAIAPRTQN